MRRSIGTAMLVISPFLFHGCRDQPDTALTVAASAGRLDEVERLLSGGVEADEADGNGLTPLIWALREGRVGVVEALLAAGADPELRGGGNGWTPLVHAVHMSQNGAALLLLDAGADVTSPGGQRALLMAAGYGNAAMVRELLARGADPRASAGLLRDAVGGAWDIDYVWPGCEAHSETVEALLEAAPDLHLGRSLWDRLAVTYARQRGCTDLLHLVDPPGARPAVPHGE
jgi:ankyrin repeat protein